MLQTVVYWTILSATLLAVHCKPTVDFEEEMWPENERHKLQDGDPSQFIYTSGGEDVVDQKQDDRDKRNAVNSNSQLWPGAVVPYFIDGFTGYERITMFQAMRHWEEKTCLRFRPRVPNDRHYVKIVTSVPGDCRSFVGRVPAFFQPQELFLGPNCVQFSTVVHEIGHAIGLFHEHDRPDRGNHVQVLTQNIIPGITGAFNLKQFGETDLLGYGYDVASIMHYSDRAFSSNRQPTIVSRQQGIPIGGSEELSPLDILKVNRLYGCSCDRPRLETVVPVLGKNDIPRPGASLGVNCGSIEPNILRGLETRERTLVHRHNQFCAEVFVCPANYVPEITFPGFSLEQSSGCSKDYAAIHFGVHVDENSRAIYGGLNNRNGRLCESGLFRTRFFASSQEVTIAFHTDGSGGAGSELNIRVTCADEDECRGDRCHTCRNTEGSFECGCRDGYYLSMPAKTCFDVNECAYNNGGCEHTCVNLAGSYRCECPSGQFLQSNGRDCATSRPSNVQAPRAVIEESCPKGPSPTQPPPPECKFTLTEEFGSIQTPNWPATYPVNFECEWIIDLPSTGCEISIEFDRSSYGIGGNYAADCPKDSLKIFHSNGQLLNRFCDVTPPTSEIRVPDRSRFVFFAGATHGPTRTGFRVEYRTVCPTPPPTLPPIATTVPPPTQPSSCPQGSLTNPSGTITSPNYPSTYPVNQNLEWHICCPSANRIKFSFDSNFWLGGQLVQGCPKDWVKVFTGSSKQETPTHGPYCFSEPPEDFVVQSSDALVAFYAGAKHHPTRIGFSLTYQCV